jgi:hypothetical protein
MIFHLFPHPPFAHVLEFAFKLHLTSTILFVRARFVQVQASVNTS